MSTAPALDLPSLKAHYDVHGYVLLPSLFPASLLSSLRSAASHAIALTRSGEWPFRRVVGTPFPPFDTEKNADSWGTQHLLHPEMVGHEAFAEFYGSEQLLDVAAALIGTERREMQMELFNLLINPTSHFFALPWHRDDMRSSLPLSEERARLQAPCSGVQWNVALYDDSCLFVVPGTHRRCLDERERAANGADPPGAKVVGEGEMGVDGKWEVDPPSAMQVHLKAGETIFYSQRILHRASYLPSRTRATLHGCYGGVPRLASSSSTASSSAAPVAAPGEKEKEEQEQELMALKERARNVLQHGVEWMREPAFGASLPRSLQPMWKNLLATDAAARGLELGYSLSS